MIGIPEVIKKESGAHSSQGKALFAWSGGKDSAMALYQSRQDSSYDIVALLTTVTEEYCRISMHGVREALLAEQAQSLGLPLEKVMIPKDCSQDTYEQAMMRSLLNYKEKGVATVIFGDIFLEDLMKYRQEKLSILGIQGAFPIWKKDTGFLARLFIDVGFEAIVTCIDSTVLDKSFCGRLFDRKFLKDLPDTVDPCGENGEFHTFVFNGPIFTKKICLQKGEIILRDNRFFFMDLFSTKNPGIVP